MTSYQYSFAFLELPAEIRIQIYGYVVPSSEGEIFGILSPSSAWLNPPEDFLIKQVGHANTITRDLLTLRQTCRQIYRELPRLSLEMSLNANIEDVDMFYHRTSEKEQSEVDAGNFKVVHSLFSHKKVGSTTWPWHLISRIKILVHGFGSHVDYGPSIPRWFLMFLHGLAAAIRRDHDHPDRKLINLELIDHPWLETREVSEQV